MDDWRIVINKTSFIKVSEFVALTDKRMVMGPRGSRWRILVEEVILLVERIAGFGESTLGFFLIRIYYLRSAYIVSSSVDLNSTHAFWCVRLAFLRIYWWAPDDGNFAKRINSELCDFSPFCALPERDWIQVWYFIMRTFLVSFLVEGVEALKPWRWLRLRDKFAILCCRKLSHNLAALILWCNVCSIVG